MRPTMGAGKQSDTLIAYAARRACRAIVQASHPGRSLPRVLVSAQHGHGSMPDLRPRRIIAPCGVHSRCKPFARLLHLALSDRWHLDAANDYLTCRVNSVELKNRLGDVETDCRDRLHVWLLRIVGASTAPTSMALPCRWRSRPQH